jgi:hypothetical protein
MVYDSDPAYLESSALSLDELSSLLSLGVSKTTLDLCTNSSQPKDILDAVRAVIGPRVEVSVIDGCAKPLGNLFVALETEALHNE